MKLDPNQRISQLSLEKRALLEAHLLKLQERKCGTGGIPRRGAGSGWPLSFGQERLWFLHNLEPQKSWYNAPHAFRLEGNLDVSALERALEEVVRRHEVLRTRYESVDGRPVQIVGEPRRVVLRRADLREWPDAEKAVEVNRLITDEASREFELSRDLVVRGALVQEQDTSWVLLLVVHHIATDEWSQGILFRELGQLYEAFRRGESGSLAELPNQYADYAIWQRQRLSGEILEQQLGYWKQQLGVDELPMLELPADRARPVVLRHRGERVAFELPIDLSLRVRDLARPEGATLFMALLAVFNVLLHRYTSHTDLAVGTPIAGRTRRELEGLIGFFVNTLVLRTNLSGDPSFRELLGRVRQTVLDAYAHQELPFERLVEELHPERSPGRNPLFQVMFVLANTPGVGLELDQIAVSSMEVDSGTAKFDLTLVLIEDSEKLRGVLEYNTDLFDADRIVRMIGHYEELLRDIVGNPEKPISQFSLLAADERSLLLQDCGARTPFSAELCAHQRFEQQAERAPKSVAVVFGDQLLTYEELNARANQLARSLLAGGLKPEDRVGVCTGRSIELIVALLGILKAGGAYVPLDPDYPDDRLSFMLQDAGVRVLLSSECYQKKVSGILEQPAHSAIGLVLLDGQSEELTKQSNQNPPPAATTDHLAYVIYTSGTTGKPKGVQVTHRNMVRLFSATEHLFQFSERDVWTLFHSYAFDFSVWEMWGALLYGGRLVVVPYLVSRDPAAFYELLVREQVTVLNQTPSAFRQLIPAENAAGQRRLELRYVIFGGEALEMQSLRPWFDRHGDEKPRLVNMYGITETTVHVTHRPLTKSDLDAGSVIGVAISDLQVYVLDQRLQPLPIGVPGELFVGGAGLARGYLNRPEYTAERFVPNPFSDEPGARLYRTGDLARRFPGGELEYLGRIDHQVKIRGFRIEPGEIESVLVRHPSVREAVVCAREESPGDKRLVAYLIASGRQKAVAGELRTFLKATLPDYMIPADYVWIEQFPLTPSGKLDLKALPAPDRAQSEVGTAFELPLSDTEEVVASIWTELLGIERPGRHDNFFALGGHSLLATRVVARVETRLGLAISLRVIFDRPTLADLAGAIDQARFTEGKPIIRPISRTPAGSPLQQSVL